MKLLAVSCRVCLLGSLFLLAAVLSSCAEVKSNRIIGTNAPANLHAFEGRWKADSGLNTDDAKPEPVVFKITNAAAGMLTISHPDLPGAPVKEGQCFFRTLGTKTFVSVPQEKGGYDFALLTSIGSNSAVVVPPNVPVFARLVNSGVLRGKVEYDTEHRPNIVTLEDLTEADCAKLFSGEYGNCFDWERPIVFVRVTGP